MKGLLIVVSILLLLASAGFAPADKMIEGKEVQYTADGVVMTATLPIQEYQGQAAGVLVVHEWWGHNEYARKRARMLVKLGYTALAVDMYGDGKQAMHPDEAGKFSSELMKNFDTAKTRFTAAMEFLKKQPSADLRLAAIGVLFLAAALCSIWRARC
jgi:dienelactone hydrolase